MQTSGSLSDATFNKKGFQSEIGLKNHLVTKLVFPHLLAISLERLITPLELCIDLNNFSGSGSELLSRIRIRYVLNRKPPTENFKTITNLYLKTYFVNK